MLRNRRIALSVAPVVAALAVAPLAAAGPAAAGPVPAGRATTTSLTRVHVRPALGGPRSVFRLSLRRPARTGDIGDVRRRDVVVVHGPRRAGCVSDAEVALRNGAAGAVVRARLVPARRRGRWCRGTFRGVIQQTVSVICRSGPAQACPMVLIAPQTIARFRFRVR